MKPCPNCNVVPLSSLMSCIITRPLAYQKTEVSCGACKYVVGTVESPKGPVGAMEFARASWNALRTMKEASMKVPKTWLITDTHFNHTMLVDKGHRPADFQARIIANWRRLVLPQDFVYHLGDVILGQNGTLSDIMGQLPGIKFLVRGNHDQESNGWYLRHGFTFVAQGILHGGVWLTHAPQATLPDGAVLNAHGHLHSGDHHNIAALPIHCKLLALEKTGYAPVEFNEFTGFTPMARRIFGIEETDDVEAD